MKKFNQAQVIVAVGTMVGMQHGLNSTVDPGWAKRGNRWDRAVWTEMAEWLDHVGWKWWKKQDVNIAQAKLEVVDIFHFMLSAAIEHDRLSELLKYCMLHGANENAGGILEHIQAEGDEDAHKDIVTMAENLVSKLTACRLDDSNFAHRHQVFTAIDIEALTEWVFLQMTFEELYFQYVGKNTLNFFRQAHGYKTGGYRKVNGGREDNEALASALKDLVTGATGTPPEMVPEFIKNRLDGWYRAGEVTCVEEKP